MRNKPSPRLDLARGFLRWRLAKGPALARVVMAEAALYGIKPRTLRTAFELERIETFARYEGSKPSDRHYQWALPGYRAAQARDNGEDAKPKRRTAEELAREREELARDYAAREAEARERWARWDAEDAAKEAAQREAKNPPENPVPL